MSLALIVNATAARTGSAVEDAPVDAPVLASPPVRGSTVTNERRTRLSEPIASRASLAYKSTWKLRTPLASCAKRSKDCRRLPWATARALLIT
nr:MAG: hypothetical protein AmFV_00083 [Apis mellifera filamentous virus]